MGRPGVSYTFASPRFTQRQRQYAERFQKGRVYTPNFAVNGRKWRGRTFIGTGD
ncbi:MAG TPA: DUF1223 domain-containing protein [Candidatus Handelsmanbacteria bacterium]|nr:DUF1223 domain-containing protein [Candidatus Handelsmanbacteria bacterium]